MQEFWTNALENWASYFSNHAVVRTAIGFAHIAGLLAGGGFAISEDWAVLRGRRIVSLSGIHRVVILGLVAVTISGVLWLASDPDTFIHSKLFWTKMGLMALLLINGSLFVLAEKRIEVGDTSGFPKLKLTAMASLILWFLTTLAGSGLLNI